MRTSTAVFLAAAAVAAGSLAEPHFPVLRTAAVPVLPDGSPPMTVLHLTDLHLLVRHRRRAAWVRGLRRLSPDLVVCTGDVWSAAAAMPLVGATLGELSQDGTPCFFVPGNNDYYAPTPPSLAGYVAGGKPHPHRPPDLPWDRAAAMLTNLGWIDLTNARTTLSLRGLTLTMTGVDDPHLRRDRYHLVSGPVTGLGVGVTHTPARRVLDAFTADGYQLLLAGHTHGGQLRLPLLGPAVTNCDLPRDRARGLSRHETAAATSWLHVSAGLGTSPYAPVRMCCRPEASLLTLTAVR